MLIKKSWDSAKFFEGYLSTAKVLKVILGSATSKRLKNTVLKEQFSKENSSILKDHFLKKIQMSF